MPGKITKGCGHSSCSDMHNKSKYAQGQRKKKKHPPKKQPQNKGIILSCKLKGPKSHSQNGDFVKGGSGCVSKETVYEKIPRFIAWIKRKSRCKAFLLLLKKQAFKKANEYKRDESDSHMK